MSKPAAIRLKELFEIDAIDLMSARLKGKIIRETKDINQSGISIETTLRRILKTRLPGGYHVGHGHVVDKTLSSCGQFDVIISDSFANPFLLKTEGDSEYVPVEAVYAVGEVKTSYLRKEKQFEKFTKHLQELHSLKRAPAEGNFYLMNGKGRGALFEGVTSDKRPRKNPLFSFMFFCETGDFKPEHVSELYKKHDRKHLPSVVCFLDSGLLVYGQFSNLNEATTSRFHYTPELGDIYDIDEDGRQLISHWLYHSHEGEFKMGTNLALLYFLLASHVHYSTLKPLEPMDYAVGVLGDTKFQQSKI